jgi:hypothetical protein
MIADGVKKAYVFSKAHQVGSWLSEGEGIAGWKLEAIDTTSAILRKAGRSLELQLYPRRQ